jgi:hypothetical protein
MAAAGRLQATKRGRSKAKNIRLIQSWHRPVEIIEQRDKGVFHPTAPNRRFPAVMLSSSDPGRIGPLVRQRNPSPLDLIDPDLDELSAMWAVD